MHVAVIGSGYVGLVTGACLAEFGHRVTCVDQDANMIAKLRVGEIPIFEPGLADLIASNSSEGRLHFDTDLPAAVKDADAVLLTVGTPSRRGDGHADLQHVYAATREVAQAISGYTVIVTKSTVPVGTGRKIERLVRDCNADADFDVVSNPEFLREGSAIEDFMRPDRIIVGTQSQRARDRMQELYRPLYLNRTPMVMTDRQTSEMIKYAANAFLATKISFINEIADLCEKVDADVQQVAHGIGLDGRIGAKFLHAGPGYGGSCFPKDTLALLETARQFDVPLQIVSAATTANSQRKQRMAERVAAVFEDGLAGKTVAVLGVTFKPNTDDMRDAPSLEIIPALQAMGAHVRAFDPAGMDAAAALLPDVEWCTDAYDAARGADVLTILTEWNQFRALELQRLKGLLINPIVVDLRNIYEPSHIREAGFRYFSIGRP